MAEDGRVFLGAWLAAVVTLSGLHVMTLHMGSLYGQSFTNFLVRDR